MNRARKQVAVVVGATSKWQSDGRNTQLAHGKALDDSDIPVGMRWGVGGAIAQKFAQEGFLVVLTTSQCRQCLRRWSRPSSSRAAKPRSSSWTWCRANPSHGRSPPFASAPAIRMSWSTTPAISRGATCRRTRSCWSTSRSRSSRPPSTSPAAGRFLVAQEVLPAMRKRGSGSFLISNNQLSLRGRKRMTGQSLYYPRVMMRTLAQVLTEEYSEHGVHVANVVIDGLIDSPGTRALPRARQNPEVVMNPVKIAEAFYYLHTQDKSCWTHELQLTPFSTKPSF